MTDPVEAPTALLVLIGAPGAGKSKIGKRVAKALGLPFIDTDKVIAAQHGPIPAIFESQGEAGFRALEREAVRAALRQPAIVALGGGAVLDPQTQSDLAGLRVLQVTTTAEAMAARGEISGRPLLAGGGVAAWVALVDQRRELYDQLTTREVSTAGRPVESAVADVVTWLTEEGIHG